MNDSKIIETIWHHIMDMFDRANQNPDEHPLAVHPFLCRIPSHIIQRVQTKAEYRQRVINIGILIPSEIDYLDFTDMVVYAPNGVEDDSEYLGVLHLGHLIRWNWYHLSPVEEDSEDDDYSYELRAEAFAAGGITGLNEHQGLMDAECHNCGGHGCRQCDW